MSKEMYSTDADGKIQDASIHDEILDNPQADYATRKQSANRARDRGMAPETIKSLYGVLPDEIPRDAKGWARGLDGEVLTTKGGKPVPASAYDGESEDDTPTTPEELVRLMRMLGTEVPKELLDKLSKGYKG